LTLAITQLKTFLQARCASLLDDYWQHVAASAGTGKNKTRRTAPRR
jgi:hypothetical protein